MKPLLRTLGVAVLAAALMNASAGLCFCHRGPALPGAPASSHSCCHGPDASGTTVVKAIGTCCQIESAESAATPAAAGATRSAGGRGRDRCGRASRRRDTPVRRHGSCPAPLRLSSSSASDFSLGHEGPSLRLRDVISHVRVSPAGAAFGLRGRRGGVMVSVFRRTLLVVACLCALGPGARSCARPDGDGPGRGRSGPAGADRGSARAQPRPARGAVGHRRRAAPATRAARALPDPMVSMTYTNDGWAPSLGSMPMTTLGFMVSQELPYSGKRQLRADLAASEARQAEPALARARLALEAARDARLLRPAARARAAGADRRSSANSGSRSRSSPARATPSARARSRTCCACRWR